MNRLFDARGNHIDDAPKSLLLHSWNQGLDQQLVDEQVYRKGSGKLFRGRGDRRTGGWATRVVDQNLHSTRFAHPMRDSRGDFLGSSKICNQNLMRLTGCFWQLSNRRFKPLRVASQQRDVGP